MGLRLVFRLSARGPAVREEGEVAAEIVALLHEERLIDNVGAILEYTDSAGRAHTDASALSPMRMVERLREVAAPGPMVVCVRSLRTAEGFPNPFWQYTHGNDVVSGWMTLRHVMRPPSSRALTLEFTEPSFLSDVPTFPPARLLARLKTLVGMTLSAECESVEPAPPDDPRA